MLLIAPAVVVGALLVILTLAVALVGGLVLVIVLLPMALMILSALAFGFLLSLALRLSRSAQLGSLRKRTQRR